MRIVEQLRDVLPERTRVVDVAVNAIARLIDGTTVADHGELSPSRLRPFSDAHACGADLLADSSDLDGTVLIPAAGLGISRRPGTAATPVLIAEPVTADQATGPIDHIVLAQAVADQLALPGGAKRILVGSSPQ